MGRLLLQRCLDTAADVNLSTCSWQSARNVAALTRPEHLLLSWQNQWAIIITPLSMLCFLLASARQPVHAAR